MLGLLGNDPVNDSWLTEGALPWRSSLLTSVTLSRQPSAIGLLRPRNRQVGGSNPPSGSTKPQVRPHIHD
jgi:hypothetical protein